MQAADGVQQACIRITNVRSLLTVLQCVKPPNAKQECIVLIGESDGMQLQLEDDSKGLQSQIFLRPDLFAGVDCPQGRQTFGLQWALLVDTLSVFASLGTADLELRYPGPNMELVFEMTEGVDSGVCIYARVSTTDMEVPHLLTDHWREPSSSFIVQGSLLKEAVDDLEWAAMGNGGSRRGTCTVVLGRHPPSLLMRASGAGALEVDFPTSGGNNLHGFNCTVDTMACSYKHKHLKAAFCNVPTQQKEYLGGMSTKVHIDESAMMKVTHMISMQPGGAASSGSGVASQSGIQGRRGNAVIHFIILPEDSSGDSD